ncbi:MAG TPA: hypothetical protein VMK31_02490 [Sphingomicrobium sp.]|nr:hypothetical protein [Sphingomicrobium sp.]
MTMLKTMLAGGAAIAALGLAAPASAQYAYPYGHNPYGYSNHYVSPYGYGYNQRAYMTRIAAQQCSAAVQHRLNSRVGLDRILAQVIGIPSTQARVLNVTQIHPRRSTIRVRGLASSGQYAYNPYGVGAYGAVGMAYQPDLSFRCDVDYRGRIRHIDIDRRR